MLAGGAAWHVTTSRATELASGKLTAWYQVLVSSLVLGVGLAYSVRDRS